MNIWFTCLLIFFKIIITLGQPKKTEYPKTHKDTISDNYFGTIVQDPYRWLENDTLPETINWIKEQKTLTDKYVNKIDLKYDIIKDMDFASYINYAAIYKSRNYYFDWYANPNGEPASVYIRKKQLKHPREIIYPNDYKNSTNERVEAKECVVSNDDKFLAFSLSRNGSDWREIRVMTIYPFNKLPDIVKWVKFSSIVWRKNGFYYQRYNEPKKGKEFTEKTEFPKIYYHTIGTTQDQDSLIMDSKDPEAILDFEILENERYLILYKNEEINNKNIKSIQYVDFNEVNPKAKYLITASGSLKSSYNILGTLNNKFVVWNKVNAPNGKIQLFDPIMPNQAIIFIPQTNEILNDAKIIGDKIVCTYLKDIDYKIVTYDKTGKRINTINYPSGCSVSGFEGTSQDSIATFYCTSFIYAPIVYNYNVNSLKVELVEETVMKYNPEQYEMIKVFYESSDGEKIPMVIAYKKGLKRNGLNPTILYGYGGYGSVYTPFYSSNFMYHLENGGIIALPCLRGGGEYGGKWHEAGKNLKKQTVFEDFIAAAEYLIKQKYTSSEKLALMGGSNGGLLVGAVLTQRPDLFKVGIAEVGVYDMLRYHHFTIGSSWQAEYGTSNDSAEFANLYSYSPLHNVSDTNSYPSMLITTGTHDDRVVPMHSFKFTATLQEKNKGTNPTLLYIGNNMGHSGSSDRLNAFIYGFIYDNLKISPLSLSKW
jgi:prolyl oligopeptidase